MGTDASPPCLAPLGAPSFSRIHTKLSIEGSLDGNNMKIAYQLDCSVPPAVVVRTLKPQTPSLQTDDATLKEDKFTLQIHA